MTDSLAGCYLRQSWRAARGLSLGLLSALGHGVGQSQTAPQVQLPTPEIYTCTDARGHKLTSDRPIPECRDREQNILNPSGTVKARVGPTLTAKERNALEAKAKAEEAQQAILEEEKRRDRALLVRYPTQSVHEKERTEALGRISRVKQTAIAQVTDLLAQKAKLSDEMAFYEKDPSKAPPKLRRQMDEVNQTLAAQGRFMADKDAEAARVNARFDAEQLRLAPLWQMAEPVKAN
ncbi:DUF4124 domain-containing protein [Rhodoferax sp.]|uniref:DUF4124 domain-containing protein n=1 Tax=Rhodoferax sp. TaxID=50421 RepID=UPI0028459DC9|nr:DUF4124 domain-containing protein [Rhodoferax sp.]MDR3371633.1 DUF4124 domain-containing protein [Rhodoferax sp.]